MTSDLFDATTANMVLFGRELDLGLSIVGIHIISVAAHFRFASGFRHPHAGMQGVTVIQKCCVCMRWWVGGCGRREGGGQIDRLRSGSARAVRTQFCFFRPQLGNVPNRSRSQGHVKTLDHILVSDLPNRSKRDRVAPISTLATQQRSSHRVSQSLLACVPCFAAVPFCQISWFMRLLRGWDFRATLGSLLHATRQ